MTHDAEAAPAQCQRTSSVKTQLRIVGIKCVCIRICFYVRTVLIVQRRQEFLLRIPMCALNMADSKMQGSFVQA